VWRRAETKVQILHIWRYFSLQLIFNILWSFCFFYLQNPRLAFLEIIALIIFIIAMMIHFYKIDKRSLYLLLPYLMWVSFATLLTYSIWQLN
jgi:tryptophan-rich sensory protein